MAETMNNEINEARSAYQGETILAKGHTLSCDTWKTGLNNNMLVLGPSGAGKTRHVLKPNILQMNASYVVLDAKGTLHAELGETLRAHGYEVWNLNFANLAQSTPDDIGYNPLAFIRRDADGRINEQDVVSIAEQVCPQLSEDDPFWSQAAASYVAAFIAYVMEELPEEEQTFASVMKLVQNMGNKVTDALMSELVETNPDGLAWRLWSAASTVSGADRTEACIQSFVATSVRCLGINTALALYGRHPQVDFKALSSCPVALFVTVSDIDRSLDSLTGLFVSQALQALFQVADDSPEGRLPHPVRLFLDDFSNLRIAHFQDHIAVTRSREIWCTILCQTISQLESVYGGPSASTIVGNCSTQLVLGFQDAETASYFSDRANKPASALLATPLDRSWLFVNGRVGELVERYDLKDHPLYEELKNSLALASARAVKKESDEGAHQGSSDFEWCDLPF